MAADRQTVAVRTSRTFFRRLHHSQTNALRQEADEAGKEPEQVTGDMRRKKIMQPTHAGDDRGSGGSPTMVITPPECGADAPAPAIIQAAENREFQNHFVMLVDLLSLQVRLTREEGRAVINT